MNYRSLIWGFPCDRITKLQMKTIRISVSKYAHTNPIFKQLHLLKVTGILKLQEITFYYKLRNGQ